uniref:MGDG synthase family glycosyltransferase n=1 Tax=Litoribacterium kuwaitense TaxID=1398745 RepID=UPI001FECBB6A|nr:UDP-glucuronosyltransferase [Litoribacterium kuwaitense]
MTQQKSILFLPFLQIPSGHHQVADALIAELAEKHPDVRCNKIDILSYSYGKLEALTSLTYLKWIQAIPRSYNWIYRKSVYQKDGFSKRYRLYELLFLPFMRKLLREQRPDLVVCTHALPSYLMNRLKENHEVQTPVINIYTDYFIHELWGGKHIDFHFTPSQQMKEFLMQQEVQEQQIVNTGIPIHPSFKKQSKRQFANKQALSLLITGGSLGVGAIEDFIAKIRAQSLSNFFVLCGKMKSSIVN